MEFQGRFGKNMPRFAAAAAYFQQKLGRLLPRPEFDLLSLEEKTRAFTVAHVTAADQMQRVYDGLQRAVSTGSTLREFQAEARDILRSPWHLETVFRTNVGSAYGAGHFAQAQQAKELRPYGRLVAKMDGRTRPSHAALHGSVYPLDHPFWLKYWPPYDYN